MSKRKITTQNKTNKRIKNQKLYDIFNAKLKLLYTARNGDAKSLKNILDSGLFDYNLLTGHSNSNILHISVEEEHFNCIEEILKKKDFLIHELNYDNESALDIVIRKIKLTDTKINSHAKFIRYLRFAFIIVKFIIDNTDEYDLEEYEKDYKNIYKELDDFILKLKKNVVETETDLSLYIKREEMKNTLLKILDLTTTKA